MPECRGEGVGYTYIADTTRVSDQAKLLYAGIKESQHGIEIKMNDQVAALIKAGQHIGMFKERVELGNDPENPLTDPKAASTQLSLLAKLKKAKAKNKGKTMHKVHTLKTDSEVFQAVSDGRKTFEIRSMMRFQSW